MRRAPKKAAIVIFPEPDAGIAPTRSNGQPVKDAAERKATGRGGPLRLGRSAARKKEIARNQSGAKTRTLAINSELSYDLTT